MNRINLAEKLSLFSRHWDPQIIAELNGQHVKLVKIQGEFVWHHHDHEDELFLVLRGGFRMEYRLPLRGTPRTSAEKLGRRAQRGVQYRDRIVELREGDMVVVPRGIEHRPVAEQECSILLFEPAGTVNTGNTRGELTREGTARV